MVGETDHETGVVRAALVQTKWTGDKESMIAANVALARQAASQGARVLCFQELFCGTYFCQVQNPEYFSYTDGVDQYSLYLMHGSPKRRSRRIVATSSDRCSGRD
jgi:hypothetical protein